MKFTRSFRVARPRAEVAAFHRRASSLKSITPPFAPMRFLAPLPAELSSGDEMTFQLWMGPIPVRWQARIENLSEAGFWDRQLAGPFASWLHHHRFEEDGPGATLVHDEIEADLSRHPLWFGVGLAMWVTLPGLFAYRGWQTRRLLEGRAG